MFRVIAGIIEGLFAGWFLSWVIFSLLLDFEKPEPDWLLMVKVIIVIICGCLGFVWGMWIWTPSNSEDPDY